jgi:2-C-methyl-D-erythritol 4-phosphate cytidylyltransferase
MSVTAIVVAAGPGTRLGLGQPKAFVELAGVPLFVRALRAVAAAPSVTAAVVVAPPDRTGEAEALLARHSPLPCPTRVVAGGTERQDSVRNGLAAVGDVELVAIHDAARPFITADVVEAAIDAARRHGAAIVAAPAVDTVKQVHAEGWIESTPRRDRLWLAQTPQVFRTDLARRAHAAPSTEGAATDDALLVELLGVRVYVVPGNAENRKITTPADLDWAEWHVRR